MRISDWSSDVCSSDLGTPSVLVLLNPAFVNRGRFRPAIRAVEENHLPLVAVSFEEGLQILLRAARLGENQRLTRCAGRGHLLESDVQRLERSEEHTSELQSLMRISYAVLCLKKKT